MATTTITKHEPTIGKRLRRKEDPRLITGTATYVDDVQMPGMHYAMVVRSPHGAAKIKGIDTSAAAAMKGVAAIFTGKDILHIAGVPCGASLPGLRVPDHKILAQDRVYFVGHPVAVVVATDKYVARDAADAIEVDYEETQAVADPEKALADGAPAVHPQWRYRAGVQRCRCRGQATHREPAPDSRCDGTAWRRGVVACGGQVADDLHLDADSSPGTYAAGADAGPG
jgi:carbon-monoxide dehydrogenase large subunit